MEYQYGFRASNFVENSDLLVFVATIKRCIPMDSLLSIVSRHVIKTLKGQYMPLIWLKRLEKNQFFSKSNQIDFKIECKL